MIKVHVNQIKPPFKDGWYYFSMGASNVLNEFSSRICVSVIDQLKYMCSDVDWWNPQAHSDSGGYVENLVKAPSGH